MEIDEATFEIALPDDSPEAKPILARVVRGASRDPVPNAGCSYRWVTRVPGGELERSGGGKSDSSGRVFCKEPAIVAQTRFTVSVAGSAPQEFPPGAALQEGDEVLLVLR